MMKSFTKKKYNFLADKTRHKMEIFDVDNTLVLTSAKIKVIDHANNDKIIQLTPEEFNDYESKAHHSLDFTEFQDATILRAGHIIDEVFEILKYSLKKSIAVGIITARDNKELIYSFLKDNGVNINKDFIFTISDPKYHDITKTVEERKQIAFIDLIKLGFTDFKFYDDNLKVLKEIEKIRSKKIKIETIHITDKWLKTNARKIK